MAAAWGWHGAAAAAIAMVIMACASVSEGVEVAGGECMKKTIKMDAETFGEKSLGCAVSGVNDTCCDELKSLFGKGGPLQSCMCEVEYYSLILESLPTEHGVTPETFVEQYNQCGIPTKGTQACGGGDPAPEVHAQIITGLIAKKFLGKAFAKGFVKGAIVGAAKAGALGGAQYYYYYDYIDYGGGGDDDDDDDDGGPPVAAAGATAPRVPAAPRVPPAPVPPAPPAPPAPRPPPPPATPAPAMPQVTAQDGIDQTAASGDEYYQEQYTSDYNPQQQVVYVTP